MAGALKVLDGHAQVIRVDARMLRGLLKEVLGVIDDELIERIIGRDDHAQRRAASAPGAA